ncbi:hypothetical protein QBC47DRAFT_385266 [Echria macrotheca]|uniref:G domain-containing protein n=1 Tax=Echria macrotheca TaxID=438768 RepID=A0AAJ0F4Z5_9PEZI|nr:hypothetical protein QBC47DRAFT_385266 [Echria macrotheca]
MTGAGKSTFISRFTDEHQSPPMGGSDSIGTCTAEVGYYHCTLPGGEHLVLIDTPGFGSPDRPDTELLAELAAHLAGLYESGISLSGIIYLHAIDQTRMLGGAVDNIRMLSALCGTAALPNLALVTTKESHGQNAAERDRRTLESLKRSFWNGLIDHGAVVRVHDGTRESASEIVDALRWKRRKPLAIQLQMVDKGLKWGDTDAAQSLLSHNQPRPGSQNRLFGAPEPPEPIDQNWFSSLLQLASTVFRLVIFLGTLVVLSIVECFSRAWNWGWNLRSGNREG